ncbi:efflux RND transporter periplasmic adaptor subunit [Ramlibacter albus]|uniref:Efflux RND transporter periplasmic adaptor subunit n=1 Tax=Ramlibacter albus TaxID=2079448 RepID=A0A923M9A5_9BURK|nr:efflux RND transporter periplasmic adaptor subunit [Ramlibacter albus]MBC5765251.1 efflux RND transporter periplasmic adaptor subunit [Ramlibacter albus]
MNTPFNMTLVWVATSVLGISATALMVLHEARATPAAAAVVAPALTVRLDLPQRMDLPRQLEANGAIAAWQEASVGSEANGLRLASVLVNVGDVVKRGQVLATFAPETVQADLAQIEAGVAEAKAHAAEATANAERARGLADSGALSAREVNQYLTAEQTALARLEAQRAAARSQQLRLARTHVLAPDDGIISARTATAGAVVPAGQELFRLIRGGRLEWRAEVTPEEATRVAAGGEVTVQAPDGTQVAAKVRQLAPTVDSRTRTTLVYVDLPAAKGLRAGMFARGQFSLGRTPAVTVPQQALVLRDGFNYVFTVKPDNHVTQVKVRTGRQLSDRVEIVDGLAPTTQIVASGAGFLNEGDLVKVVGQ